MPDFFHLDFDTTAPEITWGAVSGVGRHRVLIARYTVSEPGVAAAQFIDAANVVTDLAVYGDRVTGVIPADAAYGQGVIRAWLQDDVGNTAVRSQYVTLASPTLHIELDTTPPIITWGPYDGNEAGEQFEVPYLINEPELLNAELELQDSRVLPMEVLADRLRVTLPLDVPDGLATVKAYVRDEVGNAATRTLVVLLSGVLTPPTEPGPFAGGGLPHQRVVVRPRLVTSPRSATHPRSSARSEARIVGEPVTVLTRVQYARSDEIVKLIRTGVLTRSRADAVARINAEPSVVIASAHFGVVEKVAEGPDTEAQLLLLLELV